MTEERYDEQHKAFIDSILLRMPGVKGGKAFGYPAYKVNGKVFAFVGGTAISIKLPEARVQELVTAHKGVMSPFEPGDGYVWKAWITIQHDNTADYEQHEDLYLESLQFVAES